MTTATRPPVLEPAADDLVGEIGRTTVRAHGRLLLEHERAALCARHPRSALSQGANDRVAPVIALTVQHPLRPG